MTGADDQILILHGGLGSPYTMKVRAFLRYRRIPFVFRWMDDRGEALLKTMPVPVIPLVEWPDGRVANDSTPLLRALDAAAPAARAAGPQPPALAFLCDLIEDYADEWATKWMFHYRWAHAPDQELVSRWIAFDRYGTGDGARRAARATAFRDRQVGRMAVVGCTPENAPVIEESFLAALDLLDRHIADCAPFLFGARPSIADFALYGQLSQLADDPTPSALMRRRAPYVARWTRWMEDASGVEGALIGGVEEISAPVRALIGRIGASYLPFLAANASAIARGEAAFVVTLDGAPFRQDVFRYQRRCLEALRRAFAALAPADADAAAVLLGAEGARVLREGP